MVRKAIVAAALFLCPTAINAATPKSFVTQVAEAKASLQESADEAFLKTWRENQAEVTRAGITATTARQMTRWLIPAYGLGICSEFLKPSEHANWITSLDRMVLIYGDGARAMIDQIRAEGAKLFANGAADEVFQGMPAARKQAYCKVELTAIREFLAE